MKNIKKQKCKQAKDAWLYSITPAPKLKKGQKAGIHVIPNPMTKHAIHIVAGPTASGKSAFAMDLAQRENGVIINADSRQIFDGLPILTAQPTQEDKAIIPHELYGALHPNAPCSAGLWCAMATAAIEKTLRENKTPIVVGGTGLYLKALIEGLSPIPDVPDEIRAAAVQLQKDIGTSALHEKLKERDPEMAARFHPEHTARIVRAWEVLEATGKSLAEWQRMPKTPPPEHWNFHIHKIMPDKHELDSRCNLRFEQMIDAGVLDEVRAFAAEIERGIINANTPLTNSLGYTPLLHFLRATDATAQNAQKSSPPSNLHYVKLDKEGNAAAPYTLAAAIAQSQLDTRQYAKRQLTWFRNQL